MKKAFRILVATPLFPPDIGGPATYAKILKDTLPERDIDIDIISFGEVRHLPKLLRHITYCWRLWRALPGRDVILALDPVSVGLPALYASKLRHVPLVLKVVGDYAWEQGVQRFGVSDTLDAFVATKQRSIPVRVLMRIERMVAAGASLIITPSEYLKGIVRAWGIDEKKISVVYNAFEGIGSLASKEELRAHFDITGTVLVSVGRLVPWKGFELLITLVATLRKQFPDIRLYIIGEGPERQRLLSGIKELGLEQHVFLTGKLPQTVMLNYVKAADVFVLNTGYEGFSHQLIEVMAAGVPIVTTHVGGNPELITNEKTGLLVGYNDALALERAITRVLQDSLLAQKLAVMAAKTVTDFTVDRMVSETIRLIKRV